MNITTSNNFIKDAVIDHVLKDLELNLLDLESLDEHGWEMFEFLCVTKERFIKSGQI